MLTAVGVDPDLHTTPIAQVFLSAAGLGVSSLEIVRVPSKFKEEDAALAMARALKEMDPLGFAHVLVVESQKSYGGVKKKARPEDLINLAFVAGAATHSVYDCNTIFWPQASQWKGTIPKGIHQMRIMSKLGWIGKKHETKSGGWAEPISFGDNPPTCDVSRVTGGQWKHAMDAIGLAIWGIEQLVGRKL